METTAGNLIQLWAKRRNLILCHYDMIQSGRPTITYFDRKYIRTHYSKKSNMTYIIKIEKLSIRNIC